MFRGTKKDSLCLCVFVVIAFKVPAQTVKFKNRLSLENYKGVLCLSDGARSGSRTRILYRGTDFKSVASAIPPSGQGENRTLSYSLK